MTLIGGGMRSRHGVRRVRNRELVDEEGLEDETADVLRGPLREPKSDAE